jgi:hypothetical protein
MRIQAMFAEDKAVGDLPRISGHGLGQLGGDFEENIGKQDLLLMLLFVPA